MNATGLEEKNYPLAGKKLGNCVVPAFEISGPVTTKLLTEHSVDYIAEIVPDEIETPTAGLPSVTLVKSELVKSGESKVRWRVWKVEKIPSTDGGRMQNKASPDRTRGMLD